MDATQKVNILLVDDQPAKLLSYEVILSELGENLIKANSAREALEHLLKHDIAVVLVDVVMPELDGFQLAEMIREHPRFEKTAIIFISAIMMSDVDRLRGYEAGAVDYVPVPVVPEVLRAKVRVFAELHRKTRALEALNRELERRVEERTEALESSTQRLIESEKRRSLALAAGEMGSWDWNLSTDAMVWDEGQYRIFGVDPDGFAVTPSAMEALFHPEDRPRLQELQRGAIESGRPSQTEFRIIRPDGEVRWCFGTAVSTPDAAGNTVGLSGVVVDMTARKKAEHRQSLLVREVDHRAKNALAVVQSVLRLTRADTMENFIEAVEGRIRAIASVHTLLSESRWEGADLLRLVKEELAPYETGSDARLQFAGPALLLKPVTAQTLALAFHELATNAAKYGALSTPTGRVSLAWSLSPDVLTLVWREVGGPPAARPWTKGFGLRVICASVEQQLSGKVDLDWRPQGLVCTLAIPCAEIAVAVRDGADGGAAADEAMPHSASLPASLRALLVEDEAIVGLMMEQALTSLGVEVVGPVGSLGQALSAAEAEPVDCAILDVNLKGASVYPVADALAARGVPFMFLTGYDAGALEERFAGVPVLQKPVEAQALRRALAELMALAAARDAARAAAPDGLAAAPDALADAGAFPAARAAAARS